MRTIVPFAIAVACVSGLAMAQETERARKPSVCVDFAVFQKGTESVGVCRDGKRPKVFGEWKPVVIGGRTYVVGL